MGNQSGFAGINGCPAIIPPKQGIFRRMTDHEAQAAWRLFTLNWIPLGLMGLMLALCLALTNFSIKPEGALLSLGAIALYTGIAYYNAHTPHRREPLVIFVLGSTGQLLLASFLMTPLTYVAAAFDLPMQDANLAALDRALGIDWVSYFNFIYHRPALLPPLALGYAMIGWPVFGIPVVLGWTGRYRRLQQFTLAFALALVVTTAISALVPALGTYDELGIKLDPAVFTSGAYESSMREMALIHNGTLRQLDIFHLVGIVTFPSFHACAAVLYLWAFWAARWMRPIALLSNGAMLLATPVGGAHYFVDVFAGVAVAVLAIAAAKRLSAWMTQGAGAPVAAAPMPETAVAVQ